ncbi:MAG: H-NS family nucleoid-associated regulatory protein [Arsenophonus sp.]|nr:MAG: H-NS family nucleoid-associated regulatory protein [Arsenophonus sp.]
MSDSFKYFKSLNNIRTLRAIAREIPLESLQEIQDKFNTVVEERREDENQEKAKLEAHSQKIAKYIKLLEGEGLSLDDLVTAKTSSSSKITDRTKRALRPPKYQYKNKNGEIKTWTGQGRTPTIIKQEIEKKGKKIDDFLI